MMPGNDYPVPRRKQAVNPIKEYARKILRLLHTLCAGSPISDSWFKSHYDYAATIVSKNLKHHISDPAPRILDFGCGDGIMALGVQHKTGFNVTGVDLTSAFQLLPESAAKNIGIKTLPSQLHFFQLEENQPLPFENFSFDGVYSWSVFEHVADIRGHLNEIHRLLKPNGVCFIQIEPLFYSPYGSHLKRVIDEPWAHLRYDETTFLQKALSAEDQISDEEKDILYQNNSFEKVKAYLISEYQKLNRVKVDAFLALVEKAGFKIAKKDLYQVKEIEIPKELSNKFSKNDLITNEIRLILKKE